MKRVFDERNLLHGYGVLPEKRNDSGMFPPVFQIMITFPKVCKVVKLFEKFLITPGSRVQDCLAQSAVAAQGICGSDSFKLPRSRDQIIIPHIQQAGHSIRCQIRIIIHAVQAEVKKLCL